MENFPKHEKDQIRAYEQQGYTHNYRYESGHLIDVDTNEKFAPTDVVSLSEYRYEGISNPSDLSILYALKMNNDTKGTFLMAYGPNADVDTAEFFTAIPKDRSIEP